MNFVVDEIRRQFNLLISLVQEVLKSLDFNSDTERLSQQIIEIIKEAEGTQEPTPQYKFKKNRMLESIVAVYNTTDSLRYSMFMLQNLLNSTRDYNIIQNIG